MLHQHNGNTHQGNTHQQTPRERLEELRARQAQSGPIGGPILAAPAPQIPTEQPIAVSPARVAEQAERDRLVELRARRDASLQVAREEEVRGELFESLPGVARSFDPLNIVRSTFETGQRLLAPEAQPLQSRARQLAAQGATFGFGEELEAGLRAATQPIRNIIGGTDTSMGQAFEEQLAASRTQLGESREAAPVSSFALEAAGGGGVGGRPIARFLGGATTRGGLAGRSAIVGAGTGGVVGLGEAEGGFAERLPSAAIGAGLGAGLGGVSPVVIEGITRTGRVLARSAGRAFNNIGTSRTVTKDQRRAMNRILQRVQQDGVSSQQFQARIDRARELGLDDDFIFEMAGPQLLDLARGGTATGSEAAIRGISRVRVRQAETQSRVAADLQDAIGSDGSDFLARSQSINEARSLADPIYAQFRELPPIPRAANVTGRAGGEAGRAAPSEQTLRLEAFFDNPLFARAAKQSAASALSRNGIVIDIDRNLTPDVLDRIKRTIGEQINTAIRRADDTVVGDLTALNRRYIDFLDDQYPGVYSRARKAFAGPAAQEDALEFGEALIRSTEARRAPEAVLQRVAEMSVDELAAFRVGVARSVVTQMRTAPSPIVTTGGAPVDLGTDPANPIRRFFNTDQQREVIRAAFGNEATFTRFARRMAVESDRAESFRQINVRQGSPTQGRQQAAQRLGQVTEAATDIGMASTGNPISMLRSVTNMLRRGDTIESPAVQEEIQRILFSTPAEQRPLIERAIQELRLQERGTAEAIAPARQIIGPLLTPAAIAQERVRN